MALPIYSEGTYCGAHAPMHAHTHSHAHTHALSHTHTPCVSLLLSLSLSQRDQNVRLLWPHLSDMLRRIVRVDRNVTLFSEMFGRYFQYYGGPKGHSGTVFEALPGHKLPVRHKTVTVG